MTSAPEWYGNPVLEVMLLDHDEPTNYEEAIMSPDSAKWLEAMVPEDGIVWQTNVSNVEVDVLGVVVVALTEGDREMDLPYRMRGTVGQS